MDMDDQVRRDRLKSLNAELIKVMSQACDDLSAIVWTDDALNVRDRMQAAITATQRKQRGDPKWT